MGQAVGEVAPDLGPVQGVQGQGGAGGVGEGRAGLGQQDRLVEEDRQQGGGQQRAEEGRRPPAVGVRVGRYPQVPDHPPAILLQLPLQPLHQLQELLPADEAVPVPVQ